MKRALELLLLALSFAIVAIPTTLMVRPWLEQAPLNGVQKERLRPALSLGGVLDERYQRSFVGWYEQHYGARPTAARLDKTIGKRVFREGREEDTVYVGKDGFLFLDDMVVSYNRNDEPDRVLATYAKTLRRVQDMLAARGKMLVLLLVASEAAVFRDEFPEEWALPLGQPRPFDRIYDGFVANLRRSGALFVDGRAVVERIPPAEREAQAYSRAGRHLNPPAGCTMLDDALALARPVLAKQGKATPKLDCRYEMVDPDVVDSDQFDLLRVSNVWIGTPPNREVRMFPVPESATAGMRLPNTLVVGSSFGFRPVIEGERGHAYASLDYLVYNRLVIPRPTGAHSAVPPLRSPEWRKLVTDKDLILLTTTEEFIPFLCGEFDFVMQLLDELNVEQAEEAAAR